MKNLKKIIKLIIMSAAALGVGFAAISFPFKLFDNLSADGMRYLFIGELILYFILGMAFLVIKAKKEEQKAKEEARRFQRRIKLEKAQKEYYDLAA